MSVTKGFTLLLAIVSLAAMNKCGNATAPEYTRLFELPIKEQSKAFKQYPLEKQVDIYIVAMQDVEPPATQFADYLASNGKQAIPLLLNKLKNEKSDRRRYYFIEVFYRMHQEYYSLKDEGKVIETIREAIYEMKDLSYKHLSEMSLRTIVEGQVKP